MWPTLPKATWQHPLACTGMSHVCSFFYPYNQYLDVPLYLARPKTLGWLPYKMYCNVYPLVTQTCIYSLYWDVSCVLQCLSTHNLYWDVSLVLHTTSSPPPLTLPFTCSITTGRTQLRSMWWPSPKWQSLKRLLLHPSCLATLGWSTWRNMAPPSSIWPKLLTKTTNIQPTTREFSCSFFNGKYW